MSDPAAKRRLVANERAKVTATFLNALASAAVVVGVFGPVAAYLYGAPAAPLPRSTLLVFGACWFTGGLALHWFGARAVLARLEP